MSLYKGAVRSRNFIFWLGSIAGIAEAKGFESTVVSREEIMSRSRNFIFRLGSIAGIAEAKGFEPILGTEMAPERAATLLTALSKTKNAFSVPCMGELYPKAVEHILFIYHQQSNRLVAAYQVQEGGYMFGCTLSGGNHDLSINEVMMQLDRMKDFETESHYATINVW